MPTTEQFLKQVKEQQEEVARQLQLQMAQAKSSVSRVPSFYRSVVRGATLGYAGTEPQSWFDRWIGETAGSILPISLALMATAPISGPAAAGLGLGAIGSTALRYGLAGALTGAARQADTPEQHLQNMAVEGAFSAAIPAGVPKLSQMLGREPKTGFVPNIKENLP